MVHTYMSLCKVFRIHTYMYVYVGTCMYTCSVWGILGMKVCTALMHMVHHDNQYQKYRQRHDY